MAKLIRITTVPVSMQVLLKGQMKFMQQHGFQVTMISSNGPEVPALIEQEQCPHITVPLTRKISPWTDIKSLIKLTRILRKLKPDIVHTHTPKAGLIGMWAAKFAGVPIRLHTIAGLPWIESKGVTRTILKNVERLTAMPACRVYPNSNELERFLRNEKVAGKKMKVLGKGSSNGINTGYFSKTAAIEAAAMKLRVEKKVAPDAWVWVFVGRLVKDKGLQELLDAFQQLYQQYPDDKLWLIGSEEPELDPLDEPYKKILHAHPGVECWGFQKDIRPYLAAAQVLAFPSYREGFPNVPMQAAAMGCMLLLSDINGCNEIVQHEENGLLFPPKDAAALMNTMLYARQHPEIRLSYANAIRVKVTKEYDQQQVWNLILQEYDFWLSKKNIVH